MQNCKALTTIHNQGRLPLPNSGTNSGFPPVPLGDSPPSSEKTPRSRFCRLTLESPLRVVDDLRAVAASVGLRGLASERVVFVGGGDARGGARGDRQAAADDGLGVARGVGRVGRPGRRVRDAVEVGARDGRVAARVEGAGFGNETAAEPRETRTRRRDARQLGRAVPTRLPGRGLPPPVAAQGDVPRVVRDDAVDAFEVDLSVAVHVLDGQRPLTKGIIAKIVEGERNK